MIEARAGGRRILRGVRDPFEITLFVDGKETDADSAPTVTVTRANGTVVASAVTATKPSATTGLYRWTPASGDVAEVEAYDASWSATIGAITHTLHTDHEVAGGFYCALADIRAEEGLDNIGAYPDAKLVESRRWFEDLAERFVGRAFVPRYAREIYSGEGLGAPIVRRRPARTLLGVTLAGVAQDVTEFTFERSGRLVRTSGVFDLGDANVAVAYVYGEDAPDANLAGAALEAIASHVRQARSAVPDRALSMTTGDGTYTLAIAGPDRPTGLPRVDAVLRDLRGAKVVAR